MYWLLSKLGGIWLRRKSDNLTKIPLILISFDYKRWKTEGIKDSCCTMYTMIPDMADDEFLKEKLKECTDYINDKYNMCLIFGEYEK